VFTLYSGEGGYGDAILLTLAEMIMFASEDMHERFGTGKDSVKGIRYVVDPARQRASKADKRAHARKRSDRWVGPHFHGFDRSAALSPLRSPAAPDSTM
jgi:hypothetical protein